MGILLPWIVVTIGNLASGFLIHYKFFTDHVDKTASLIWKLSLTAQIVLMIAWTILQARGITFPKFQLLKSAAIALMCCSFFIERGVAMRQNARNSQISEAKLSATQSRLDDYERKFSSPSPSGSAPGAQETLDFVLFVLNSDLGYMGLPDLSERASGILEKGLSNHHIDPNLRVEYRHGTDRSQSIQVPLFAYPVLVRDVTTRPQDLSTREKNRILRFITMMKANGADTAWRDPSGKTILDYEKSLR